METNIFFFVFFDFIFMRNKFRLEQIPKLQSFSEQWLQVSFLLEEEAMHNCVATATESLITETPSISQIILTPAPLTVFHLVSCSSLAGGNLIWIPHQDLHHMPGSCFCLSRTLRTNPSPSNNTPLGPLWERAGIPVHLPLFRVETSD